MVTVANNKTTNEEMASLLNFFIEGDAYFANEKLEGKAKEKEVARLAEIMTHRATLGDVMKVVNALSEENQRDAIQTNKMIVFIEQLVRRELVSDSKLHEAIDALVKTKDISPKGKRALSEITFRISKADIADVKQQIGKMEKKAEDVIKAVTDNAVSLQEKNVKPNLKTVKPKNGK